MNLPEQVASTERSSKSPSGEYILVVVEETKEDGVYQSFQILDSKENLVFTPQESYTARSMNFFLWDDDGRVWVYSGDLGTFFWESASPVEWIKYSYVKSDVSAPDFLKEIRPQWHEK